MEKYGDEEEYELKPEFWTDEEESNQTPPYDSDEGEEIAESAKVTFKE